jgi:septum site-determining protein MinD
MGTSIIVASAKGGVGKTNTISNLGVALSNLGKKVALVDGSLTTPDLGLHLGIPFHVRGLANILKEKAPLESAVFHHKSGMKVYPGNVHVNTFKEFEGKEFANFMKTLKKENDFVLVDCSAGLGKESLSAMKNCDKMLVVTNPELPSVVNSSKLIQTAKQMKLKTMGVILNRVGRFNEELKENEITPLLHKNKILGSIMDHKKVPHTIKKSEVMVDYYPRHKISREFRNIAESIAGIRKSGKNKKNEKTFFGFKFVGRK